MESRFDVLFTGGFREGVTRESALERFAERFNLEQEKAEAMLPAGGRTTLKRGVDRETAEKYRQILESVGVEADIEPATAATTDAGAKEPAPAPGSNHQLVAGSDTAVAGGPPDDESGLTAEQFNPYARAKPKTREAVVDGEEAEDTGSEILSQRVFEGAVAVPVSRGVRWLTEGYGNHVHKDLGAWIGAVLLFFLLSIVLSFVPLIGSIALMLISPVIMAGFMIGAREQSQGGSFSLNHMFAGFDAPGQLMLLALFYFLAMMIVVLVTFSIFGMSMLASLDTQGNTPPNPAVVLLPILVMLALMLPVLMAYWFAPALIALEGLSVFEAMKQSFLGCLKNILPFLVYGVVGMVLAIIAAIPLMLGYILLMPVMFASIYVAYRDIFHSSESVVEF